MKTGVGKAHGKIILVGEHAVVYGKPAIALPLLDLTVETKITILDSDGPQKITDSFLSVELDQLKKEYSGISALIKKLIDFFDIDNLQFELLINNKIPQKRGLGSSAALSVSIVRSFFDAMDKKLDTELEQSLANFAEKITHTNSSGLDTAVVASENPIWYQKNKAIETFISSIKNTDLIIVDSGVYGKTSEAVLKISELRKQNQGKIDAIFDEISAITDSSKKAIASGNAVDLGELMNTAHLKLKALDISTDLIDEVNKKSVELGAFGAKLTGGGLGGSMIILTKNETTEKIIEQIKKFPVKSVWKQKF